MTIKPATRQGVRPLIGVYAESGCGKSLSSLYLARGFVGPQGRICMVDSESGRGELYADVVPGGYDVLRLDPPFTPATYIAAHDAVVSAGYSIGIFDSGSHEWSAVLEMAGEAEEKSGRAGLHNWKKPKMEHEKFLTTLLRSPIPWIVCLRAKLKSKQTKDERGKTVIIKGENAEAIQSDEFLFEMTAHGEVMPDHSFRLTKCSHPSLRDCFPTTGPITIQHGEKIAAWCASGGRPVAPAASKVEDPKKPLMDKLYKLVSGSLGGRPTWPQVSEQLKSWKILQPTDLLSGLNTNELESVIDRVEIQLQPE